MLISAHHLSPLELSFSCLVHPPETYWSKALLNEQTCKQSHYTTVSKTAMFWHWVIDQLCNSTPYDKAVSTTVTPVQKSNPSTFYKEKTMVTVQRKWHLKKVNGSWSITIKRVNFTVAPCSLWKVLFWSSYEKFYFGPQCNQSVGTKSVKNNHWTSIFEAAHKLVKEKKKDRWF